MEKPADNPYKRSESQNVSWLSFRNVGVCFEGPREMKKSPKDLAKLLAYALGRRPDEFALVPDAEGFIRVKSLLQALNEEVGWGYVRESHVREVMLSIADPPVELSENRIRALDRTHAPTPEYEPEPPGLLYGAVRKKAWPHVRQKGLRPGAEDRICLALDKETALRRGRRIDPEPVLVTVHTTTAADRGVVFFRFGEKLFLSEDLPPDCITGPPLPKVKEEPAPAQKPPEAPKTPGSFLLDLNKDQDRRQSGSGRKKRGKDPDWKKEQRKSRRR